MFYLHAKQINNKDLIKKRHNNLILPDAKGLNTGLKGQIRHNPLRFFITTNLLSSKMASF
jgi:hypothetical protein